MGEEMTAWDLAIADYLYRQPNKRASAEDKVINFWRDSVEQNLPEKQAADYQALLVSLYKDISKRTTSDDYLREAFARIRNYAIAYLRHRLFPAPIEKRQHILQTCLNIAMKKHYDYGSENILLFEVTGILIRVSDKLSRIKYLFARNASPQNESVNDTMYDIINYCTYVEMLLDDNWPLEEGEVFGSAI